MNLDNPRALLVRLFMVAAVMLVVPTIILSVLAVDAFEQSIKPEMDRKAAAIGRDVTAQVARAVGHGIPIAQLVGVDEFFAPLLKSNPEIRYLAITDLTGRVLFLDGAEAGTLEPHYRAADPDLNGAENRLANIGTYVDLALPVSGGGRLQGFVHVGFAQDYVASRLTDVVFDVGIVLAVALIVAFEILLFVVFFNITGPLSRVGTVVERAVRDGDFSHVPATASHDEVGRFARAVAAVIRRLDEQYRALAAYMDEVRAAHFDKSVASRVADIQSRFNARLRFSPEGRPQVLFERRASDIRLALFLFVFAEELSRPFLPLYAAHVSPAAGLAAEMVMALPIALFMACTALASPMGGALVQRMGSRRMFLWGMVPAVFGYVMTGLATGLFDLGLWRAVTGVGYAVVTMACQGYMAGSVRDERRTQGLGAFLAAVLTAGVCGTALGGVLAERVGYRTTFFVSAALVVLAGLLVSRLMEPTPAAAEFPARQRLLPLLRNWRFSVLMAFAAVPAKVALTGFLFFLVPVALARADWEVGEIAQVMVLYPLVMWVVAPLAARLADRFGWRAGLVAVGGLLGGIGLLAPLVLSGPSALAVGVVALGLAQGLSGAPMLAVLPDICWNECRSLGQSNVLGFVRFIERLGSTAGPLLAAAFLIAWGVSGAMLALGAVVLVPAALFAILSAAYRPGPPLEAAKEIAP